MVQPYTHYLVLDFEASGHTRDSQTWEIVEFPCVIVDARTGEGVREFHRYVRPTANPMLSEFCTAQCGITQEMVAGAGTIGQTLSDFIAWVDTAAVELPMASFAVLTCGDYDLKTALRAEAANKDLPALPTWLRRWVNVKKTFAERYLGTQRPKGMAGMLAHLRIPLEGRHHSGIDDVKNIVKIVRTLLDGNVPLCVNGAYGGADVDAALPMPLGSDSKSPPPPQTGPARKKKSRVQ